MQTSNQFSSIKANLKELSSKSNSVDCKWTKSLKKSLFLMQTLNIPSKNKSVLETKLYRINEALILSDGFEVFKAETFKLLLNICMSLLEVSIKEFNSIYSACVDSSIPFDFFSLLSAAIYLKIEKTFNNDLEDKRLKDYLSDVLKIFGFKDLSFLLSVINHELDPERSPETTAVKLRRVTQMIFGSSKNYKFYLKGSTHLCNLTTQILYEGSEPIDQDSFPLNVKVSYDSGNKEWTLCRFGLDEENSRFDKIVTIGANTLSDICVEGIKNIACGIVQFGNKLWIVDFNEKIQFIVRENQNIVIENGAKVWFGGNFCLEFVDLSRFFVSFNDRKVDFEEKVEYGSKIWNKKFDIEEMIVEVSVLEIQGIFILWCSQRSFLYEHGRGEYKPVFLCCVDKENLKVELNVSKILIDGKLFQFTYIN